MVSIGIALLRYQLSIVSTPSAHAIAGCWVAGMCDPHGPAASAALSAFTAAFTLTKQREVFKFGLKAIVVVSTCIVSIEGQQHQASYPMK